MNFENQKIAVILGFLLGFTCGEIFTVLLSLWLGK